MQMKLMNGCSPSMEKLDYFHNKALLVILCMSVFVGCILVLIVTNDYYYADKLENSMLEVIWTVVPGFILLLLAIPSLSTLYYLDLPVGLTPKFTLKVTGHQWYWDYSHILEGVYVTYSSFMLNTKKLRNFRCLEVKVPAIVPGLSMVRTVVSSMDVIHSFSVPQLGVKIDGVPGRLNQVFFLSKMYGKFYGQCSEMCGANHSFMPISMESIKHKFSFVVPLPPVKMGWWGWTVNGLGWMVNGVFNGAKRLWYLRS